MFNFEPLDDLELTPDEMRSVSLIFPKIQQHMNQAYWAETPQLLTENFVRGLAVCRAEGTRAVASVVAAQAILESGWFATRTLFGVKATKLQKIGGEYANEPTHEVENGTSIPQVDAFFETPSIQNNFGNYFNYLTRRKAGIWKFCPLDAAGYLAALQNPNFMLIKTDHGPEGTGSYSTAGSAYVDSVNAVISSNKLDAFDRA